MKRTKQLYAACVAGTLSLSGCYVVPVVDPQGNVQNYHYPLPPAGAPVAVASAAVPVSTAGGSFMSCGYQMNNPRQGAGTCTFSNGARYKPHVGS